MKIILTSGIAVVHILFTLIACTSSGDIRYAYWTNSHYVDQIFTRWNKPDSPGAAVVVLKNGSIIHKRGYGKANLKNGMPITSSTVFEVGSIAKQFTAMAIALLTERGKISLDDDIRKYVPEVYDFGKPITIRHLIYHTSGMRNWEVLFKLVGYHGQLNSGQVLDMIYHQKELNFDPGEEYTYCNTGYLLLAEVVQRVTGQSFPEWTRANIFEPLEMTNTRFCDDPGKIMTNRALGYMPNKNGGFRELLPISETTFRVKQADIHMTFVRNEHLEVEEVLTRFGKWKRLLPARKEQSISPSELKKFAGNYHSRELNTTWTFYTHEGQLRAKHESEEEIRLVYTGANRFVGDKWWFQQIEFSHDDNGRIIAFRLSAEDGLVRGLRFERTNQP